MPGSKRHSIGRRIIHAGIAVGFAHLLFKLAGMLQAMVMARYVDPGIYDVVYVFAFEGCIFSLFLIGEEVIGPTFLPMFMREMDTRSEDEAWGFANAILSVQFLILLGAVFAIMFFPDFIVGLLTHWTAAQDPAEFALARRALVWLAPSLVCLSLGSTTYMLLNGYKRFFLAAFGDALWKFCVLLAVLVGMGMFGWDYRAIVFGLLAGSIAKLAVHLAGLTDKIRRFRPSFRLRSPAVRGMFLLMLPLIGGIVFAKVRDIYNNVTVLSYLETEGLMMANSFGRKLYVSIGFLVPYSLSIAIFPFFCELVDRDDRQKFGEILSVSARMLLAVFLPLSFVCLVVAQPISSLLFESAKFTPDMVRWTAVSMACYTLVLPAQALEYLLMQAFFANRRMVSVTVVGVVFSAFSIALSFVCIRVLGATGVTALAVVALGFALSRTLKTTTLIVILKRNTPFFPLRETSLFLMRLALVGVAAAAACAACRTGIEQLTGASGTKLSLLCELGVCGAAAFAAFLLSARILRLEEPFTMFQWAMARLRK